MQNNLLAQVELAGQRIVNKIKANISRGLDVNDKAFAALKDGSGKIPLNRTQQLLNSITYRVHVLLSGSIELILRFGAPYGAWHITGTRKMVARPFMPQSDTIPDSWKRIIKQELGDITYISTKL